MGKRWLLILALGARMAGAATNDEEAVWTQHVLESYRTLQEQQQATLRAVQQARDEAAAESKRQTELLEARMKQLESAVGQQRDREVANLRDAHRFTLVMIGLFGAGGLAALVLFVRWMSRRPATVTMQPLGGPMPVGQLAGGETGLANLDPAQQSNARLKSSLDRLEQRLTDLETTAPPSPDVAGRMQLLLGKGQALVNLQQTDTALACFDEAIALDPTNAEAFVRKGAVLEKLERLDEAIQCYDKAIALDTSMTMAYLGKGGVFNRLERYSEAVQCYEQALRAQQQAGL